MNTSPETLRHLEIPGVVRIEAGAGGLTRVAITSAVCQAHVYLHGAHVTHWQPAGASPVLFLSEQSLFAPGKAIRGGIPVIFPWFGPNAERKDLPVHGFARTREWELESVEKWPDETVALVLRLISDDASRALWPHDFVLRLRVMASRQLELRLEVENWSEDAFTFEEALHTYLAVREVRQVSVAGLEGVQYLDKTDGLQRKTQEGAIRFESETDRVYTCTEAACVLDDPAGSRRLRIGKDGSRTTVVWNPWIGKAAALPDFGDEEWPRMACVETANAATDAITLQPRESHVMQAVVGIAG